MRGETWGDGSGFRWTIAVAETRAERRHGLLSMRELLPREGLFLPECRSVHTVRMRFPIDVVMLDDTLVVQVVATVRPGRVLRPRRGVRHVLEIAAGSTVRPGDRFRRLHVTSTTSPDARRTIDRGSSPGIRARTSPDALRR
jgi:uncharacterized membrane protein (UPF0127 family)